MYRDSSNNCIDEANIEEGTIANIEFEKNHNCNNWVNRRRNKQSIVYNILRFSKEKEDIELMEYFSKRVYEKPKKRWTIIQ